MLSPLVNYRLISQSLPDALERTANEPQVEREIAYYRENIKSVKSIDDFMADDRLFNFAMTAHGLDDMSYAKAFMRKVLEGGIDDPESFANRLRDPRYQDFATTFNFARYEETTTVFTRAEQGTIDRYVRQTLEVNAGADSEAVRLALYFERKAPEITDVYELLGDRALLSVTQTLLQLPPESSLVDIERQAELIESRLDLEDFKDPAKLQELMERFTVLWEVQNPTTSVATSPAAILIGGTPSGISESLLASIQQLGTLRR